VPQKRWPDLANNTAACDHVSICHGRPELRDPPSFAEGTIIGLSDDPIIEDRKVPPVARAALLQQALTDRHQ